MDNTQAKIFAAQLDGSVPVLDLHGLYVDEALEKLELFLFDNYFEKNKKVVRIIYGGGTGVLGNMVIDYLDNHNLAQDVIQEFGSCLVVI